MKLIGYLIITVSLCAGALATITAYVPTLDKASAASEPLTLNSVAGAERIEDNPQEFRLDDSGARIPVGNKDQELDAELIKDLRDANAKRVRVKEFSFDRWQHAWLFGLAVLGLIIGGALVKTDQRRDIARRAAQTDESPESPESALKAVRQTVDALIAMPPGEAQQARLLEEVGELQQTHLRVLADSRAVLIGRLGMGGYAQFMDRYSALERQLNRSWSAAADEAPHESEACLKAAHQLIPEVEARMKGA